MARFTLLILAAMVMVAMVTCLPRYRDKIPNGHKIPNPDKPGEHIHGVGHVRTSGGGEINQFGKDFYDNGHVSDPVSQLSFLSDNASNNHYFSR